MPEKWTGELLCRMHLNRIRAKEVAQELGVTEAYVSLVLSGRRCPKNAQQDFNLAVDRIAERRTA